MGKSNINLLPTEVVVRREESAKKKSYNLVAVGFFLVSVVLSLIVSLYSLYLTQSLKGLNTLVKKEEGKINDLKILEQDAIRLEDKSSALTEIFNRKKKFSKLLEVLSLMTPEGVKVTSLSSSSTDSLQVSGAADSYINISQFLLNILNPEIGGTVFSGAELNSVNLDERLGGARFLLTLRIKPGSLKVI